MGPGPKGRWREGSFSGRFRRSSRGKGAEDLSSLFETRFKKMRRVRYGRRHERGEGNPKLVLGIVIGCVVLVLLGFMLSRRSGSPPKSGPVATMDGTPGEPTAVRNRAPASDRAARTETDVSKLLKSRAPSEGKQSPQQVVADKVAAFAQVRLNVAEALATRLGMSVPQPVRDFFGAVQAADWGEIKGLYGTLEAQVQAQGAPRELQALWPAIKESYGAAQLAQPWSSEQQLEYGP